MTKRTSMFNMLTWNGGLNTSVDPGAIPPNQLVQADNIVFNTSGTRKKREGITTLANHTAATGDVIGGEDYWHEISSGKQQRQISVKRTASAITFYLTQTDGTIESPTQVGPSNLTAVDATNAHIEVLNNSAIISFDGSTTPKKLAYAVSGVAEVTSITTVADVAASLDGKYFILYDDVGSVAFWFDVDNNGTAEPSHGATRSVEITTVVTGDSAATVATAVQGAVDADAKFSASVNSATVTVTASATGYRTDGTANTSGFTVSVTTQGLGAGTYYIRDLPGSPPNFSISRKHLGRLFTNDKDREDYLHYSSTGNPEQWLGVGDSGGINDLGVGDGDPTGISAITPSFKSQLYVGKQYRIYRIGGFSPETFTVQPISSNLGIVSHKSCVGIEQDDVAFASERGFHSIVTTANYGDVASQFLSADIQPTYQNDLETDRRTYIKGAYVPTLNSVAWAVTENGGTKNNRLYLFNILNKQWYSWTGHSCESIWVAKLRGAQKLVLGEAGSTVGMGRVLEAQMANRYHDFTSDSIEMTVKTGLIFPDQNIYMAKGFKKLGLVFKNRGSTRINVDFQIDDFASQPLEYTVEGTLDLLGVSFILGVSKLGGITQMAPIILPVDGYGRGFQITIVNDQLGEPTEIYGFFVELIVTGDQQESSVNREAS